MPRFFSEEYEGTYKKHFRNFLSNMTVAMNIPFLFSNDIAINFIISAMTVEKNILFFVSNDLVIHFFFLALPVKMNSRKEYANHSMFCQQ